MKYYLSFSITVVVVIITLSSSRAEEVGSNSAQYLNAQMPKRWALVVGNSDYVTASKLPGSTLDAEEVASLLEKLQFNVRIIKNIETRTRFVQVELLPFLAEIDEGDVVLFYFSGHGFSYAGEDYLVPLSFPTSIKGKDIFTTFVNVRSLVDLINERRPAFTLILLDACRSIGNFIDDNDSEARKLIAKGLNSPRLDTDNVAISYSSDLGKFSFGSTEKKVSVYTRGIREYVPTGKEDWDRIKKQVRTYVRLNTNNEQTPWFSESSSAEFYFNITEDIAAQQKELWEAAMTEGTVTSVSMFLSRYGTGPYGAAARNWIRGHPDAAEARASAISPQFAENIWRDPDLSTVEVSSPLQPASVQVRNSWYTETDWASKIEGPDYQKSNTVKWLTPSKDTRVVASSVIAKSRPDDNATNIKILDPGTTVRVTKVEQDGEQKYWQKITIAGVGAAYVKDAIDKASLSVGSQIAFVDLEPVQNGIGGAMNSDLLISEIKRVTANGSKINWVSIAVPRPQTPVLENLLALRAISIIGRLVEEGIPREQITVTQAQSHLADNIVQVRVYGN